MSSLARGRVEGSAVRHCLEALDAYKPSADVSEHRSRSSADWRLFKAVSTTPIDSPPQSSPRNEWIYRPNSRALTGQSIWTTVVTERPCALLRPSRPAGDMSISGLERRNCRRNCHWRAPTKVDLENTTQRGIPPVSSVHRPQLHPTRRRWPPTTLRARVVRSLRGRGPAGCSTRTCAPSATATAARR
jgi:hypothetical protein